MRFREHDHDGREARPQAGLPLGSSDLRANAEGLLVRGADAIDRALSQDSAVWLAATRQEGGQ